MRTVNAQIGRAFVACTVALSLVGCQAQTIGGNVLGSKYNLFYT